MEIVKQDGSMDCGVSCLLSIIRYYGGNIPIEYLREQTNTTNSGVSAYKLVDTAKKIGFEAYGLNGKLEDIKDDYLPLIAHVIINKNLKHFIVIYKIDKIKKQVIVMDPDKGKRKLTFSEFNLMTSYNFIYLKKKKELPNIKVKKFIKRWLYLFSKSKKSYLFYIITFSILNFILNIICSFHFTFILNNSINLNIKENAFAITKLLLTLYILKSFSKLLRDKTSIKFSILLDEYITKKYYHKLILLPYIYYKNRTTGEIISRMEDLNTIKEFLTNLLVTFTTDILVIITFIIILFKNNKVIFVLNLSFTIILLILQYINNTFLKSRITNYKRRVDKVNSIFIEAMEKSSTIKNLHLEATTIDKFNKVYDKCLDSYYSVSKVNLITNFLNNIFHDSFYIIFFLLLSIRVINKKMSIGMIIILDNIIKYFLDSYSRILILYNDFNNYKISKKRIEDLFMIREEDFSCSRYFSDKKLDGIIKFRNLTYSFNSNKLFDKLNLVIKPKEKIFFYGESGSGKSTLMKMLMRYVEVPSGSITINGIDINHHHLEVIRKEISYVSQNENLFKDSIKNNITLNRDISYEELDLVCNLTNVKEIVLSKDTEFNTLVENGGFSLSGGERQRIILARTLLNKSNIYIFDEALSQIDEDNERHILKNIFSFLKDKTIIVISHRMTNKDLYSKIISLEEGKIHEEI